MRCSLCSAPLVSVNDYERGLCRDCYGPEPVRHWQRYGDVLVAPVTRCCENDEVPLWRAELRGRYAYGLNQSEAVKAVRQ